MSSSGSKGGPKPPTPIDPQKIIDAQSAANRIDRITPFGSQSYGKGANGQDTFTTTLSPEMQSLVNRSMTTAQTPLTPLSSPQGMGDLQSALMARAQAGAQPQAQKPQQQPMQQIGNQPVNPAWNQALGQIWGGH